MTIGRATIAIMFVLLAIAPRNELCGEEGIGLSAGDPMRVTLIPADQSAAAETMQRFDRDGDGVLTVDEMERLPWLAAPQRFDVNRNNRLTELEVAIYFANVRRQFRIRPQDVTYATKILNCYDTDGNNALNRDEAQKLPFPIDLEQLDANRDDEISVFELAGEMVRTGREHAVMPLDQWYAVRYIHLYDANDSRALEQDEVGEIGWPSDSLPFDANGDQRVTFAEIASGLAQRRAEAGVELCDEHSAVAYMHRFDANDDRQLDLDELAKGGEFPDPSGFDADRDARATVFELAVAFAKRRQQEKIEPQDRLAAAKLITRYDTNRNGSVDLNELLTERHEVGVFDADSFIQFDVNDDQLLSRLEVAAFLARQRHGNSPRP